MKITMNIKVYQRQNVRMVYPDLPELFDPEGDTPECIIKTTSNSLPVDGMEWQSYTDNVFSSMVCRVENEWFDLARDVLQKGTDSQLLEAADEEVRARIKTAIETRGLYWAVSGILRKHLLPDQDTIHGFRFKLAPNDEKTKIMMQDWG